MENKQSHSFSRFGRNLEKTQFQVLKNSTVMGEQTQHVFNISPHQPTHQYASAIAKPVYVVPKRPLSSENHIFKRVGRNKQVYFKGAPCADKPIEPRYNPKFDMLYPHVRECFIKPVEKRPQTTPVQQSPEYQRPLSQTMPIKGHIPLPVPLHLQTGRPQLIPKPIYKNFDFWVTPPPSSNRSHSFASYLPHQLLKETKIMPEYDVSISFDKTQSRRPSSINFGKQRGLIVSRLDKDKSLNTSILDYDQSTSYNHLSHVKRVKKIDFSLTPGRSERKYSVQNE